MTAKIRIDCDIKGCSAHTYIHIDALGVFEDNGEWGCEGDYMNEYHYTPSEYHHCPACVDNKIKLSKRLTQTEKQLISLIREYNKKHKEFPTIRELCDLHNTSSAGTMHRYLESLEEKEVIRRIDSGWRGRELVITSTGNGE